MSDWVIVSIRIRKETKQSLKMFRVRNNESYDSLLQKIIYAEKLYQDKEKLINKLGKRNNPIKT